MTDLSQLLDQVRDAVSNSRALCIVGGDSKKHLGREQDGIPLKMRDYAGVVDYQPEELVITSRAGTTISALNAILAQENQMLAGDPPEFDGKATIGGTLACNQSGPSRPWHGSIRDQVLGIRLINGNAEHLHFGGQVMKNVAGYDVSRLQAGAMGTLGLITEVSLRVLPKPESSITVRRRVDANSAIRVMNEVNILPAPLTGACWYDGHLYFRVSGSTTVTAAAAAKLEGERLPLSTASWTRLREQMLPFFASAEPLWRFSVRPTSPHFEHQGNWLIDWGGAQRLLAGQYDRDELDGIATKSGGELSCIRGGDRTSDVFSSRVGAHRTMLVRLKQAFDPKRVFNPGRLYSWM